MTWREVQQLMALLECAIGLIVFVGAIKRLPATWRRWIPSAIALVVNGVFYFAVLVESLGRLASDLSPARSLITITMVFVQVLLFLGSHGKQ